MTAENSASTTFNSEFDVAITIPHDKASLYVVTKASQLAALNSFIAGHVGGFEITVTDDDMLALTGLANELSHAVNEMAGVAIYEAKKGGA